MAGSVKDMHMRNQEHSDDYSVFHLGTCTHRQHKENSPEWILLTHIHVWLQRQMGIRKECKMFLRKAFVISFYFKYFYQF